jgi:drug/metabolite transporter (DMT)-like permease
VDVASEVSGSSEAALSVFRLVGALTLVIAALVAVLGALERVQAPSMAAQWWKYAALAGILIALGSLFLLSGRARMSPAEHPR